MGYQRGPFWANVEPESGVGTRDGGDERQRRAFYKPEIWTEVAYA